MFKTKEVVIGSLLGLAGAGVFLYGFNRMNKYNLIKDIPSSKIRSIAMGLVEVNGNVVPDKTIKTPFSNVDSVYYRYKIEEYVEHTSTDSKGMTHTTHQWQTLADGERRIPFFAKDETGSVYVNPQGGEFNVPIKKMFLQKPGMIISLGPIVNLLKDLDKGENVQFNASSLNLVPIDPKNINVGGVVFGTRGPRRGDRRYYEYYIEPGENVYVMGTAANNPGVPNNVYIHKGENEPTFIISNRSEKELLKSIMWQMIGCFAFGGIMFIAGIIMALYFAGLIGGV